MQELKTSKYTFKDPMQEALKVEEGEEHDAK